jgi:putative ubiquitin-RnfH superfamily antitoxin RatB of RatAB toxin-antitoxin module
MLATDPSSPCEVQAIEVMVVYAPEKGPVWLKTLSVSVGSTVQQAIAQSQFADVFSAIDWRSQGVGIFGQRCKPETVLRNGDRIEIYRALVFDPKESRRRRAAHRKKRLT